LIKNVNTNTDDLHEIIETGDNKFRKKLVKINMVGLNFDSKKELIKKELEKTYGSIPEGITFRKLSTQKSHDNPDGFRVLLNCNWIKRNRFYDYKGEFKLGRVFKAINKQIEGTTNKDILI